MCVCVEERCVCVEGGEVCVCAGVEGGEGCVCVCVCVCRGRRGVCVWREGSMYFFIINLPTSPYLIVRHSYTMGYTI